MMWYLQAAIRLNKGIFKIHPFWVGWIQLLIVLNGVVPLFFWPRPEAVLVFVSFWLGAAVMAWLTGLYGFSRILGLAHLCWMPFLIYLPTQLGNHPIGESGWFGWWLHGVMVIDLVAVGFDAWDVSRWLRGDRAELVSF